MLIGEQAVGVQNDKTTRTTTNNWTKRKKTQEI